MKKSIKITLACIPLVTVPITHISGISNKNINGETLNKNNYNQIANQLKNKLNVKNWIKDVHGMGFQNYEKDVETLYNLDLTNIQKEFLKQNLQEKYQIQKLKKDNIKKRYRRLSRNYYFHSLFINRKYLKLPSTNNELVDLNGNKITFKGPKYNKPTWQIHDFPFKDDVSYLNWNNQTILNNMIALGIEETNFKKRFEKIKQNIKEYNFYWKNYEGMMESLNDKNINTWGKILIALVLANGQKRFSKGNFLEMQTKEIETLVEGVSNYVGIDFAKTIENKDISNGVDKIKNELKNYSEGRRKIIESNINKILSEDIFSTMGTIQISRLFISAVVTKVILAKAITYATVGAIVAASIKAAIITGLSAAIIFVVLSFLPSGNGYTWAENWHDHGLNDWEFQVKNNFKTLSLLAKEWSNNYQYPITWKVSDGWFTTPKLWISRGVIRYYGGPHGNWTQLKPFNWGRKTHFRKYPS